MEEYQGKQRRFRRKWGNINKANIMKKNYFNGISNLTGLDQYGANIREKNETKETRKYGKSWSSSNTHVLASILYTTHLVTITFF